MNVLAHRIVGKLLALEAERLPAFTPIPIDDLISRLQTSDELWDLAAAELRIGSVSHRTRSEVLDILERATKPAEGDPFAGFPKF